MRAGRTQAVTKDITPRRERRSGRVMVEDGRVA